MKVIYPDKVSGVTAEEQHANYPDDNVLDEHPKKVWAATSADSGLTVSVNGGANAVFLAGCSATSLTITVKDSNVSTTVAAVNYDLKGIDTYYDFFTDFFTNYTSYWIDYTYQDSDHFLVFDFLENTGSTVQVGVVRAGAARSVYEPDWDLTEGFVDYSITRELNNGAFYHRKRDIVKTFSGSVELERAGDYHVIMRDILQVEGQTPLAWRILDYDNQSWAIYARLQGSPVGSHNTRDYSVLNFDLIEVL